ncbi:hypothetical protein [Bacillus sonorensis]|nr:hypothetical protein [Bacillus sonorensis]MCY8604088.1 hypothetical protein [Bacillus sonorensis]
MEARSRITLTPCSERAALIFLFFMEPSRIKPPIAHVPSPIPAMFW